MIPLSDKMKKCLELGKTALHSSSDPVEEYFMNQEIFEKVKGIVAEQLEVDPNDIKPESNFANDLQADSLDTVELVMALEEEFDIEIPDDAAEQIDTVQKAVDYISNKVEAPA